jgi:TolA-binding protein
MPNRRLTSPVLRASRAGVGFVLASALLAGPAPALAQDEVSAARIRKIEAEIRALQRNVFPGGDGTFFEPQVSPAEQSSEPASRPSTSAITDVLARLDALELQLQRLTGLAEENANALSQVEARLTALERSSGPAADPAEGPAATEDNLTAMTGNASGGASNEAETVADDDEAEQSGPSPERVEAIRKIPKPQTGDPGEDEYTYGFRLWDAGFYPEARQQLASFVEEYPDHPLITFGRNLLGRAFLDDGMPEEAARWFLRNYQADRTARRAPDSLLYLAESMIEMDDERRACVALAEFAETYPAIASGRLSDQYERNRRQVSCE